LWHVDIDTRRGFQQARVCPCRKRTAPRKSFSWSASWSRGLGEEGPAHCQRRAGGGQRTRACRDVWAARYAAAPSTCSPRVLARWCGWPRPPWEILVLKAVRRSCKSRFRIREWRMPGGALRLTGRILHLAHLVHVHETDPAAPVALPAKSGDATGKTPRPPAQSAAVVTLTTPRSARRPGGRPASRGQTAGRLAVYKRGIVDSFHDAQTFVPEFTASPNHKTGPAPIPNAIS